MRLKTTIKSGPPGTSPAEVRRVERDISSEVGPERGLKRTSVQDICVVPLLIPCPWRSEDVGARVLGEGRLMGMRQGDESEEIRTEARR